MPWLTTDGSSIPPLLFAVAFLWSGLAVGRRLLLVLGSSGAGTPVERGIIAAGLGAGSLQFLAFGLGSAGALGATSLRIAAALVCLVAAPDLRAVAVAAWRSARGWTRPDTWVLAWIVALGPAVLMAFLVALAPTLDPDGLSYHLTVPKLWMGTGWLGYLPTYPLSNAPMGMEMLFALAMAFAGEVAARCVHFTLGLLAAVAVYRAGTRLQGTMTGAVATTMFLVGPASVTVVLGCAYVEGAASLATAAAALAWLLWFQTGDRGLLRSAALLAGLAVSFKISAALFPVALLALTCVAAIDKARTVGAGSRPVLAGVVSSAKLVPLVAAPVLPWMAHALILTGNPFFPLFANWIPSRDLSAALAVKVDRFNRYMTWGNVLGRDWTLQQRQWVLIAAAAAWAVLGVIAFFKLRSWLARATVVVAVVTALGQLSAAGLYLRYWIPLAAVLVVLIAAALDPLLSRRAAPAVWLVLTLAGSLLQASHIFRSEGSDGLGLVRTVVGLDDRRTFLLKRLPLYPLYERANRDLPASAGIMLSGYCGGFYIDRTTFCAEMVQDSLRFTSWEEFTSDLQRLGITHLIAPSVLATGGPTPSLGGSSVSTITREGQYRLVRRLLTGHARTLATASDQGLYEIDGSLSGAR